MNEERGTQPMTRSVEDVVEAIKVVEAELEFQVNRLTTTAGRTADENDHLTDLTKGYETARRYLRILRRYQEGRIERKQSTGKLSGSQVDEFESIRPTVDDEESPA